MYIHSIICVYIFNSTLSKILFSFKNVLVGMYLFLHEKFPVCLYKVYFLECDTYNEF